MIEEEEEWEVEKMINKKKIQGKEKYLVLWKRYTVEEDTWKNKENLKNMMKLVEGFKRNYSREEEEKVR